MASLWSPQLHAVSFPHRFSSNATELRLKFSLRNWNEKKRYRKFVLRVISGSDKENGVEDEAILVQSNSDDKVVVKNHVERLQEAIGSLPPLIPLMKRLSGTNFAIGLCIATTLMFIVVRVYAAKKSRNSRPGSVADLVRRGQLRSDRRGISRPLEYDDPFNNPLVKVGNSNSTVEMCGKVYRLAPVTLTTEQRATHQKRRSRAYQWKRPTTFLKEGDLVPPDVDPDAVRWIPANHPFATTTSDIDEDLAQTNVYQKHGVPFRIQAEHEALQRKLEALQKDQKFNNLAIDPGAAKDFERPFKSHLKSDDHVEQKPSNGQVGSKPPLSDNSSPEDNQKP